MRNLSDDQTYQKRLRDYYDELVELERLGGMSPVMAAGVDQFIAELRELIGENQIPAMPQAA